MSKKRQIIRTCIIISVIAIFATIMTACSWTSPGAIERNTAPSPADAENYPYVQIPGETNLVYLRSTKIVHEVWHNRTSYEYVVDIVVPFAPAYGFGGVHVYYLPDEDKLVNENGVEVPGIYRRVGDRPRIPKTSTTD